MADYTKLTDTDLASLLEHYDLGDITTVSPLEGGQANSSLKITSGKGSFTLSVCDEKNAKEIETLTGILEHLEQHDFPTTRLVKTKQGRSFILYQSKPVYIKKFLDGQVVKNLSSDMISQVGNAMAALHRIVPLESMPCAYPYGIEAFETLLASDVSHEYLDWLAKKKDYLESAIDPDMPKGVIHGDIFWDNLLFEDQSLAAVLDFEEACWFYRFFDVGMAAVGCCAKDGCFNFSSIEALLDGYTGHRPFTGHEKSQLNVFIEYAAVAASFWRFRQYNVRRPDPEKANSYMELSSLADQIHNTGPHDCFIKRV